MSIVIKGNSLIEGQPLRCYDNGGKTYDRYTVVYMGIPRGSQHVRSRRNVRGAVSPQGFGAALRSPAKQAPRARAESEQKQ